MAGEFSVTSVYYPIERDAGEWSRRFELGEVPSRWPYGLDRVSNGTADRCGLGPRSRASRARAWLEAFAPRSSAGGARLVWDENTAMRLTPRRGTRRFAGVIWLTDRPGRGVAALKQRAWLTRFDGLWVLSRAQVEPLRRLLGPFGPPVSFVRFGIDERFFLSRPSPDAPRVLSVGGDRDRDAETLFLALDEVRRAVPQAEIVVQTTSDRRPPDGVQVVRRFSHAELREQYARASVVAIATRPNLHVSGMTVSLESMATARPVVITASPGMEDYVRDGVTGLMVPSAAPAPMAEAVIDLLRDPDRARSMGAAGRLDIERRFTTTQMCRELDQVITPFS